MKLLGLVGGTSWVSTLDYYRLINEFTNHRLGGNQAARLILYSLNFGELMELKQRFGQAGVFHRISEAARILETAGAQGLVLCANTLHLFADQLSAEVHVPLIHIADATAAAIKMANMTVAGLLGTKTTMSESFYRDRLQSAGIETLIPDENDQNFLDNCIWSELARGIFNSVSRERILTIMAELNRRGAEGIILGCTEIPLLIHPDDASLPVFNTTAIHARAAVDFALQESSAEIT